MIVTLSTIMLTGALLVGLLGLIIALDTLRIIRQDDRTPPPVMSVRPRADKVAVTLTKQEHHQEHSHAA